MPDQGRVTERAFAREECAALGDASPVLGETAFDVYLNGTAFWRNVPAAIWAYKLGAYQGLKKWLSDAAIARLRPARGNTLSGTAGCPVSGSGSGPPAGAAMSCAEAGGGRSGSLSVRYP